jgi:hypothetical protein
MSRKANAIWSRGFIFLAPFRLQGVTARQPQIVTLIMKKHQEKNEKLAKLLRCRTDRPVSPTIRVWATHGRRYESKGYRF